jgi:sortase A
MLAESPAAATPAATGPSERPSAARAMTSSRAKARPALAQGVLGRIEIPRLRRTAIIAEGASDRRLRTAVGHIPSTALPGHRGNCGLAGHRDTYLKGLDRMRRNDLVHVRTPRGRFTYEVNWTGVVGPRRTDVLRPTSRPTLTLVTCYPFQAIGPAPARYIVRARLVEPMALAHPSGTPAID